MANDVRHRIISVDETMPMAASAAQVVLLFPKWIPGDAAISVRSPTMTRGRPRDMNDYWVELS